MTHANTLVRLGQPRRPGTATMRRVIESRPAWRAAVQSELELLVLNEIERQGLPAPEVQHRLDLGAGWTIRLDFAWPPERAALEVDHPFWHAGAVESHRDKRRDLHAAAAGWLTARITDLDVAGGLPESIATFGRALSLR